MVSGWRGVSTTGEGVDIMCSLIHGVTSLPKNQNLGRLSAARGHGLSSPLEFQYY